MAFPVTRMRRLRRSARLRSLVCETKLNPSDFVMPLFLVPGDGVKKEINSLPGQYHLSIDACAEKAKEIADLNIPSVLLFGIPESKDPAGSSALKKDGIIQRGIAELKESVPDLTIITDLCFCEYTDHGHCGIVSNGSLDNDATLEILAQQAVSHAGAGADMIAPSGMIDGAVAAIRSGLDSEGFEDIPVMSYSAKYASAFYGPFREAVDSAPQFGDRKSYQMDPGNISEAIRETALDIEEGADIVMVKPALAFLDVIAAIKDEFEVPTAAYNVSGEYAMIKAAAEKGWIDGEKVMLEALTSIKRAGADIIITYFAEEAVKLLQEVE